MEHKRIKAQESSAYCSPCIIAVNFARNFIGAVRNGEEVVYCIVRLTHIVGE
jgi:hypothetical protein